MKDVICYYHNDMDGIVSAAIVKKVYPDAKLIPVNYGDEEGVMLRGTHVDLIIVVDFSFDQDVIKQVFYPSLVVKKGVFCWIDHHKSAMEKNPDMWNSEEIDGLRDCTKSGCELTWDWFFPPDETPEVVKYVGDYDTWTFKYGDKTKLFGEGLALNVDSPHATVLQVMLENHKISQGFVDEYIQLGHILIKARDIRIKKAFENGTDKTVWDYKVRICNSSNDVSNLGNYCCKQGYDIGLVWSVRDGKILVGLRSLGDIDVSVIAKKHGGGGHKNASGFQLDLVNKDEDYDFMLELVGFDMLEHHTI